MVFTNYLSNKSNKTISIRQNSFTIQVRHSRVEIRIQIMDKVTSNRNKSILDSDMNILMFTFIILISSSFHRKQAAMSLIVFYF